MKNRLCFLSIVLMLLTFIGCSDQPTEMRSAEVAEPPLKTEPVLTANTEESAIELEPETPELLEITVESPAKNQPEKPVDVVEKPAVKPNKPVSAAKAVISFEKTTHNYGRIEQGEKVEYKFKFTNTGNKELVISNATATCGCTHPIYPFIPIGPGESNSIGVIFDSTGKLGKQRPAITIQTNANPPTYKLYLEGEVDSPDRKEASEATIEQ